MANEIISEIRLELDKFKADLKDAQKASEETAKNSGHNMGSAVEQGLSFGVSKLVAVFAAAGSAIAGAFTLKESIAAASEQENAINSLNSAMALSGTYSDQASQHLQNLASSLQLTTTSADEVIVKGAAMISTLGKLSGESLDRATKASLDLASALGISVEQAFTLVGKASTGHTEALSRYGITVAKTGDNARDFTHALEQLEKRFGGIAALQANTFSGAMAQTKNQFGEILESIGNTIIKSDTVIAVLKKLSKVFADVAKAISDWASGRDLINEITVSLIQMGEALVTYVAAPLELAYNIAVLVFNGLKTLVQGALTTIVDAVGFVTSLLAPLGGKFAEVNSAVQGFAQSSGAVLEDFKNQTSQSLDGLFNFNASDRAQNFLDQLQIFTESVTPQAQANFKAISEASVEAMKPVFVNGWDFIVNGFNAAFGRVALTSEAFKAQLQQKLNSAFTSFRDGVASSFAAIGAALVKGENAFAAFGKAILGVFGDLAIQVGSFYFLLGLANLFLNPAAAATQIAGGLALIVLGGALKALAGGAGGAGGGTPSTSSGGGVAAAGGGGQADPNAEATSFNDTQRGEVGTKVNVNVQGNVFDRRETGLQIADAINEAFGSNGVTFATGAT